MEVEDHHTIASVRAQIEARQGFPPNQRLFFVGKQLEGRCGIHVGRTLASYNIQHKSVLNMAYGGEIAKGLRVLGGSGEDVDVLDLSGMRDSTIIVRLFCLPVEVCITQLRGGMAWCLIQSV